MTTDYLTDGAHAAATEWLLSRGFVRDGGSLGLAWSTRAGHDFATILFWPHDTGWEVVIRHHGGGENPSLAIGTCETLADVQMVYDTIRRINGYQRPEDERPRDNA